DGSFTGGEVLSEGANLIYETNSLEKLARALHVEALTKFDSFSAGAYLVEEFGAGSAGMAPYIGALVALVPRALLPFKPVPGSVDGTYRGHPSRLIATAIGYDPDSSNVGVSPAAITIWQLGYPGLVLLVLANVIVLKFINSLLLAPSVLTRTL